MTYKLSTNQFETAANLKLYRLEKENRLDCLAKTTNSSPTTQINKVLSLNKRYMGLKSWIPIFQFTLYHCMYEIK